MRESALASIAELRDFIESGGLRYAVERIRPVPPARASDLWFDWLLFPALEDQGVSERDFTIAVESLDLSLELDLHTVGQALQWLRGQPPNTRLSARISSAAFVNRRFTDMVVETFDTTRLSPQQLCFDLKVDDIARNLGGATRFVRSMRDLGSLIALDCDVAGDPMLSLLASQKLIAFLKIERKWVAAAPSSEAHRLTLRGICDHGKALGLKLIGKGVDQDAHLKLMSELGVDYYQGFIDGEPRLIGAEESGGMNEVHYGRSA